MIPGSTFVHPIVDLLIAAALGGAVGVQRQAVQKPAGFRTHLLVSLGSCAFTIVGLHAGDTRIAANVLTGIGFLGAGAIVRSGLTAHGLTTAASIWTVAAIGVTIGFALPFSYEVGVATTIITLIALAFSDRALMNFFRFPRRASLSVTYANPIGNEAAIAGVLRVACISSDAGDANSVTAEGDVETTERLYRLELHRDQDLGDLAHKLSVLPGVVRVSATEQFPG